MRAARALWTLTICETVSVRASSALSPMAGSYSSIVSDDEQGFCTLVNSGTAVNLTLDLDVRHPARVQSMRSGVSPGGGGSETMRLRSTMLIAVVLTVTA